MAAEATWAKLTARVEQRVVEVAAAVQAELQIATPVDTGFARANWQLTVGAPASGEVGLTGGDLPPVTYRIDQGPVFITNNAEYIRLLNAGWSKQAEAGFVQLAIARGVAEVRR